MDEKSVANKLDTIFSDIRLNSVQLAMLTRKMFSPHTTGMAGDWWMYHNMDMEAHIRGDNDRPFDLNPYDR